LSRLRHTEKKIMTVQANTAPLQSQIAHWEAHHNRRLLIYLAGEGGTSAKGIDERDVLPLYTALRAIGNQEQLDILLFSGGGRVNSSRRICLLFREYTSFLRIFVPYKARSAGTLLCLGSDEIVLGPLGELGPIDPQIMAQGDPAGGPQALSPEDLRAFFRLSEDWLDLHTSEQRLDVLRMISNRIFPLTLGTLYRADRQIRQIGQELLRYQLPDLEDSIRSAIIDRLVSGFGAHDYSITADEARDLGLNARRTQPIEHDLLWEVWQTASAYLQASSPNTVNPAETSRTDAFIACADCAFRHITRSVSYLPNAASTQAGRVIQLPIEAEWQPFDPLRDPSKV
jgi:hypothetical protein